MINKKHSLKLTILLYRYTMNKIKLSNKGNVNMKNERTEKNIILQKYQLRKEQWNMDD